MSELTFKTYDQVNTIRNVLREVYDEWDHWAQKTMHCFEKERKECLQDIRGYVTVTRRSPIKEPLHCRQLHWLHVTHNDKCDLTRKRDTFQSFSGKRGEKSISEPEECVASSNSNAISCNWNARIENQNSHVNNIIAKFMQSRTGYEKGYRCETRSYKTEMLAPKVAQSSASTRTLANYIFPSALIQLILAIFVISFPNYKFLGSILQFNLSFFPANQHFVCS